MGKQAPQNLLVGQAGVWRVASMLALRGVNPCFPGVDHGFDLVLPPGIRIQVKAASLTTQFYPNGSYNFRLRKSAYASGNNTIVEGRPKSYSDDCDFVILWGIDEDRFWIVPANILDWVSLITVGPKIHKKNLDVDEIRSMYDAGDTQVEIAKKLGVQQMTVSRRLNGKFAASNPRTAKAMEVRSLEDRWDLIDSCSITPKTVSNMLKELETIAR